MIMCWEVRFCCFKAPWLQVEAMISPMFIAQTAHNSMLEHPASKKRRLCVCCCEACGLLAHGVCYGRLRSSLGLTDLVRLIDQGQIFGALKERVHISPSSPQEPQTFEARHRWRLLKPDERPHVTWVVMGWLRRKAQDKIQVTNEVQSQTASEVSIFCFDLWLWDFFGIETSERREARAVVPSAAFEAPSRCVALSESRRWWQQ